MKSTCQQIKKTELTWQSTKLQVGIPTYSWNIFSVSNSITNIDVYIHRYFKIVIFRWAKNLEGISRKTGQFEN